jgi:hypothetical protein
MKRVILGANPAAYNGGYGLWVSKPGKDAGSTNMNDFLVAPNLNNTVGPFSIILPVGAAIPLASQATGYVVSIDSYGDAAAITPCVYGIYWTHSLGFVPMVWTDVTASPFSNSYYNSGTSIQSADAQPYQGIEWYVVSYADNTKVGIEVHANLETQLNYGGSITNYPIASTFLLGRSIHLAVMGVQVA